MSAHTPGPWAAEGRQITGLHEHVFTGAIAHVYGEDDNGQDESECLANARLIAAAPDLLDVARRVAEHFADTDAPLGLAAAAAIAKAEGR